MANSGGMKETHRVAVINKKQYTPTLASAFVKDLDSFDTFSIKFQGLMLSYITPPESLKKLIWINQVLYYNQLVSEQRI